MQNYPERSVEQRAFETKVLTTALSHAGNLAYNSMAPWMRLTSNAGTVEQFGTDCLGRLMRLDEQIRVQITNQPIQFIKSTVKVPHYACVGLGSYFLDPFVWQAEPADLRLLSQKGGDVVGTLVSQHEMEVSLVGDILKTQKIWHRPDRDTRSALAYSFDLSQQTPEPDWDYFRETRFEPMFYDLDGNGGVVKIMLNRQTGEMGVHRFNPDRSFVLDVDTHLHDKHGITMQGLKDYFLEALEIRQREVGDI